MVSFECSRSAGTSLATVNQLRMSRCVLIWLAGVGIVLVIGGCQRADGPGRIAVVGSVTSQSGDPVDGTISFLPERGTKGPAATASLVDGTFKFDRKNGPVAGRYRVLVVKHLADAKYKGASSSAAQANAPAATSGQDPSVTEQEWSFAADVSNEDFEFDFEVPDATVALTSG